MDPTHPSVGDSWYPPPALVAKGNGTGEKIDLLDALSVE